MKSVKRCYRCRKIKSVDLFHNNVARKDGKQSFCKPCHNTINVDRYYSNRKKYLSMITINKRRRVLKNYVRIIIEYFSKPCADCGKINHPSMMVFDHVDPSKKNRIAKSEGVFRFVRNGYSWSKILEEIEKCEVRCQNCHFHKTSRDFKYWTELSAYVEDFYGIIKKLHKYKKNGNISGSKAFKIINRELKDKFSEFMNEEIENLTFSKKQELKANEKNEKRN